MDTMGKTHSASVRPCQVCTANHFVDATKKVGPEWDKEGNPLNLQAAAEDAYEWLKVFPSKSYATNKKLEGAIKELRRFLDE